MTQFFPIPGVDMDALSIGYDRLVAGGALIVSPTKVGYICMTTDGVGLERKFEAKQRKKSKPGVVLCSSLEQLFMLAETDENIRKLYQACWDKDILLGCILPWKPESLQTTVPQDGSAELMADSRNTSCFVIKYGKPSEAIAEKLWTEHKKLPFASSANPSWKGNRGQLEWVWERILSMADIAIQADEFVAQQQPNKDTETRYEQGVMISMVDENGALVPKPTLIRKGLACDKIMHELAEIYTQWDYRHGQYY